MANTEIKKALERLSKEWESSAELLYPETSRDYEEADKYQHECYREGFISGCESVYYEVWDKVRNRDKEIESLKTEIEKLKNKLTS